MNTQDLLNVSIECDEGALILYQFCSCSIHRGNASTKSQHLLLIHRTSNVSVSLIVVKRFFYTLYTDFLFGYEVEEVTCHQFQISNNHNKIASSNVSYVLFVHTVLNGTITLIVMYKFLHIFCIYGLIQRDDQALFFYQFCSCNVHKRNSSTKVQHLLLFHRTSNVAVTLISSRFFHTFFIDVFLEYEVENVTRDQFQICKDHSVWSTSSCHSVSIT